MIQPVCYPSPLLLQTVPTVTNCAKTHVVILQSQRQRPAERSRGCRMFFTKSSALNSWNGSSVGRQRFILGASWSLVPAHYVAFLTLQHIVR